MAHREFDAALTSSSIVAVRHDANGDHAVHERVAEETPVALIYNGVPHVVMMVTPQDIEDLVLGFSITEGIIESAAELGGVEIVTEKLGFSAYLSVPAARMAAIETRRRNMAARTGCGLCGAETIGQAIRSLPKVQGVKHVASQALVRAMATLPKLQTLNAATGATHAAGWAEIDGNVRLVREDVGRHNALDKLIGALLSSGQDRASGFVVVTSRASYEMVQKSAAAGIGLIAAVSAPTGFAARTAIESNVTLVGFARNRGYVVYADNARRITMDKEWQSWT
ncbi:MAG: formate dehydrogenase accessory sulfurtransferase FdhD [Burkholderiales bacterium]